MDFPLSVFFDEIFSQMALSNPRENPFSLRKVLFLGERIEEIGSYVAGWMAGRGVDTLVLDGANRFDPYIVSTFARRALIPPEKLLKKIQIARAFTCYQMATLMGEKLLSFVRRIRESSLQKPHVILLGPITTFLDEDVHERDARLLFERSLWKVKELSMEGIPFFLFQSESHRPDPVPFRGWGWKGQDGRFLNPRGIYLARRLFQLADSVWRVDLGEQVPKVILEKGYVSIIPVKTGIHALYGGSINGTHSCSF
jgi:hypothetical protein